MFAFLSLCLCVSVALASDLDEFKVKREGPFEFAEKPSVARQGDKVTITFETKAHCDVTVAIEAMEHGLERGSGTLPLRSPTPFPQVADPFSRARIIRHLASGVLGPNAPPPFQKNSKRQVLIWDSKDDHGRYVTAKDSIVIRASLGLKPRFERTLFWSPKKRPGHARGRPTFAAAPEGVYVYDSGVTEHLRLFDHAGDYLRTIYPFPAAGLDRVEGLTRRTFPGSDRPLPVKWGWEQATLLSWNSKHPLDQWPAGTAPGEDENLTLGTAAVSVAAHRGRVALVGERLNRLAADGTSGGVKVPGPGVGFTIVRGGMPWSGGGVKIPAMPVSAALSPDGRTLYLAGYTWLENWDTAGHKRDWLHGVASLEFAGDEPATVFAGSVKQHDAGTGDGRFGVASCVAVDAQGRVYAGDYMNDRIQVFDPAGKLLKSIRVAKPARIVIHPKSNDIYVFSWLLSSYLLEKARDLVIKATLTQLGPFDDPKPKASWGLPFKQYVEGGRTGASGTQYWADLDFFAPSPTVWIVDGGIRLYALREGQLELTRDFEADVRKEVVQPRPPYHARQRLAFNPRDRCLYVIEQHHPTPIHSKGSQDLVCLDPETGRGRIVSLPAACEDLAFDGDGYAYLRSITEVARFDSATWEEYPFDYGEELLPRFGYQHRTTDAVRSGLRFHGESGPSGQLGGMSVSPNGDLVLTLINRGLPEDRKAQWGVQYSKGFSPVLFPGRIKHWEVLVFDKFGRTKYPDAVTGIGYMNGIGMDRNDFLYIQAAARPLLADGKPYPNPLADTLLKIDLRRARIVGAGAPNPLPKEPPRPPDVFLNAGSKAWITGLEWKYPGVGLCGKMRFPYADCFCQADSRFALDLFARSFAAETQNYNIAVLDSAGNLITRIGRYGNVDDGVPLVQGGGPRSPRAIGGDEVALVQPLYLAVDTDRRLFATDIANARIVSVHLGYHSTERVPLKDAPETR